MTTKGVRRPLGLAPTAVLLLGALYCLLPVCWVLAASTKTRGELFTTNAFAPGTGLFSNIADLSAYRDGIFWQWMANTALYAGVGALLSTAVSVLAGYALAKFRFFGRNMIFNVLIGGILVPAVVLAVPQYLLLAKAGLANTYWAVLLPSILHPYSIYLARIYASAAIPDALLEAGRIDGAGENRLLRVVAVPLMLPGMVTIFLFQFVAIWNNFLLPFIMLADDERFPLTVGLYTLLATGANQPALYNLVITGALLSIIPLIALFLTMQRYWRTDLSGGSVKS
ncbi:MULTISPECIES: carbohydrate ABC transporter permease [Catellatospora]|uniref:Sugar ABC transporter permease n=2 Tax=Catellatospora TaxID=53365 RepID=A0A8J3KTP5_9ACTN|nr:MULTISPECIES: carbohydrate ABC transporter permease [Catellatospora]RKE12048.1 multiple sugar transport system permease protein [Catellatospora citrea]GIF94346.1 sugar ABC transporter permease [Catellatospora chokoriensis]GIG02991.1 sugar ABC transporter permease [Catellatospora citrea]